MTRSSWLARLNGTPDIESIAHGLVDRGWTVSRRSTGLVAHKGDRIAFCPLFAYKKSPRRLILTTDGEVLTVQVGVSAFLGFGTKRHVEWLCEIEEVLPGVLAQLKASPPSPRMMVWAQLPQLPFSIAVAFVLALALRTFIIEPFGVVNSVMAPAIPPGGRVLLYKGPWKERLIGQGSIVVTREGDRYRIARVVAEGPGKVRVENGHTILDGKLLKEPFATFGRVNWELEPDKQGLVTAFDVRDSYNSFGLTSRPDVIGVALALYYPRPASLLLDEEGR